MYIPLHRNIADAAIEIAERLKILIDNDPFIYLAYHLDNRNLSTEEFAKSLPVERRYRTVNTAAFKLLLEVSCKDG